MVVIETLLMLLFSKSDMSGRVLQVLKETTSTSVPDSSASSSSPKFFFLSAFQLQYFLITLLDYFHPYHGSIRLLHSFFLILQLLCTEGFAQLEQIT